MANVWREGLALVFVLMANSCDVTPIVTEADNGRTVVLDVGQTLVIRAQGAPSTGFSWEDVTPAGGIARREGPPTFESGSSALGGSGYFVFRFRVVAEGTDTLRFVYRRAFEEATPAAKVLEVRVEAK